MFECAPKPGNDFVLYMSSVIIPIREGLYKCFMNVVTKLLSLKKKKKNYSPGLSSLS